jgi:uncharacterized protein (TIGR03118 family)
MLEELTERCLLSAGFAQDFLIANTPGLAQTTDANLVNPWGLAAGPTGPFSFAANNSGIVETQGVPAVVIPSAATGPGEPTGLVFNPGPGFVVSSGGNSGSSVFLFATEDGLIGGWNPSVDPGQSVVAIDQSAAPGLGPIFTGLTIASNAEGTFLFAANFRTGAIDVFNQEFQPVRLPGAFVDPNLPAGYVPFNIEELGGSIFVAYTPFNQGNYDPSAPTGIGFVDRFDTNGNFLNRVASGGSLDAPWGLALAPGNFGAFSNDLLVGNFGNGQINAFNPNSGVFLGTLTGAAGAPIVLPQLWGLAFGNGSTAGPANTLFFTAGLSNEAYGLFGSLQLAVPGNAGALSARQQGLLYSLTGAPTADGYPLPPAAEPALQQTPTAPEHLTVVLAPLGAAPAAVPTLWAAAPTSPSGGAAVAMPASATPLRNTGPFAPFAPEATTFIPSGAVVDGLVQPGFPGGSESPTVAMVADLPSNLISPSITDLPASTSWSAYTPLQAEDFADALAVDSISNSPVRATGAADETSLFGSTLPRVGLLLLAAGGFVPLFLSEPRLPLVVIKSLWSQLTGRLTKSGFAPARPPASQTLAGARGLDKK